MVGREEETRHWAQSKYEQQFYELKEKNEHNTAPPHSTTIPPPPPPPPPTTTFPMRQRTTLYFDSKQEARG